MRLTQHYDPGAADAHFVIEDNTFDSLTLLGIEVGQAAVIDSFQRNSFTAISASAGEPPAIALNMSGDTAPASRFAMIARARGNQFIGNDIAIHWKGVGPIGRSSDFGKVGDLGNNVFRCNSTAASSASGYDIDFGVAGDGATTLYFAGNAWDNVPPTMVTQGTAPNGTDIYAETSPAPLLVTDGATRAMAACPSGRTP